MGREAESDILNKLAESVHEYSDEEWCFVCDRPKEDCGCVENGGTY